MAPEPLRVLLADAEEASRRSLTEFLNQHSSFSVNPVVNSEQAWRDAKDKPYDVALIDVALPGETRRAAPAQPQGMNLMKRLKDRSPKTGVILFRHSDIDISLDEALQGGAFRYLDKKYPFDELLVLMSHAARDHRYHDAVRSQPLFEHLLRVRETSFEHENETEAIASLLHGIQQLDFDRVRIYIRSDDGQHMIGAAHVGMSNNFVGIKRFIADDAYMQELLQDQRPRIHTRQHGQAVPLQEALDKDEVNEWVCIPLIARGGELIGALSADNKTSQRTIHEVELGPVTLVAGQVASTIAHARLSAERKRRLGQLENLRQTTLAITSEQDPEQLLRIIIDHAVKFLNAKGGGIYQYDSAQNILTCVADYSRPNLVGRTLRVGEGLVGSIVAEKAPHKIIPSYLEWTGAIWLERLEIFDSLLGVPLLWYGDITGVLFIGDGPSRHFQEADIKQLQMFADQAAVSLVNAQRTRQDTAKLIRLEQVARATKEITDNLDNTPLDQRLALIAQHAIEILDAEVSGVLLVQPSGRLRLEAGYGHIEAANEVGKEYAILDGNKTGLTSHIAATQQVFNFHGEALWEHPASDQVAPDHLPSGRRYSMLVVPLKQYRDGAEQLAGLLRVENKKGADGKPRPNLGFTEEDAWILTIFAEAAVTAISNAHLVTQLRMKQQQWQRLVTSSPHGIIALDHEGTVLDCNPRARQILST